MELILFYSILIFLFPVSCEELIACDSFTGRTFNACLLTVHCSVHITTRKHRIQEYGLKCYVMLGRSRGSYTVATIEKTSFLEYSNICCFLATLRPDLYFNGLFWKPLRLCLYGEIASATQGYFLARLSSAFVYMGEK